MRILVVSALWVEADDFDAASDAVASRLHGLKSEGTQGAVVSFDGSHEQMPDLLAELRRLNLAEVGA